MQIDKTEIKTVRKRIAQIIEVNLPLIKMNRKMCQEVADAIILYMIEVSEKYSEDDE